MLTRRLTRSVLPVALGVVLATAPVFAAEYQRPIDRSFDSGSIHRIELENLAGEVRLVPATGTGIRVTGTVFADASAGETAHQLGESLEIEFDESGGRLAVRANYPLDEHRRYHYPRSESSHEHSSWLFDWGGSWSSSVRYQGRSVRVTGSTSGGAATVYADFRIEIPAGVAVTAKNAVGVIDSDGVRGDQTLDSSAGPVIARRGRGELSIDTGSGDVLIEEHEGHVYADTGSGDVRMVSVRGDKLEADTGSGDVEYVDCRGSIDADTGSGNVVAKNLVAGALLRADTGSGDVRVDGDLTAVRNLDVDTGSGDVVFRISGSPSVQVVISTGSGDIDFDLEGARLHRVHHGDFVAELGTGEGNGKIDTGSGDVRLAGR